jgi:predicted O-methyltransferase YrrM
MSDKESAPGPATEAPSHSVEIVAGVEGWLYDDEVDLLYRLASEVRFGVIVEIGSYRGKSTVALALGSRDHHRVPVYAIDPHETFSGVMGFEFRPADRTAFLRNILRCEVSDIVRLVNLQAHVAAAGWELPLGLLWIDGDHRYESVKRDLDCWKVHLEPGVLTALHDSTDPALGPQQAIREAVEAGDFEFVELVGSTTVLRRVARR